MNPSVERAVRIAARTVVDSHGSLRSALAEAVGLCSARRDSQRLMLWQALPGAVSDYQALFRRAAYAQRQQRAAAAAADALQRFADLSPALLGPVALGLAADDDRVDLAIYLEEDEALLRRLLDDLARFETAERKLSLSAAGAARRCTTVEYAEATADVRLTCLPSAWRGRQLYCEGLPELRASAPPSAV